MGGGSYFQPERYFGRVGLGPTEASSLSEMGEKWYLKDESFLLSPRNPCASSGTMGFLMEDLPEELLVNVVRRIDQTADRNSISLVSKRLYAIDGEQRDFLRVGCGLHPAIEALTSLCIRFPNVKKLEIVYSGWMSNLGKQLDNQGLFVLSSNCHSLTELTLSFCSFINDSGLAYLSSCRNLRSLKLNFAPAISSSGILSLVIGCKNLSSLHLIRCMKLSSVEWLEYLGKLGKLEDLLIKNCRAISEDDLLKLGPGWNNLKRLEFEMDAYYRYPKIYDSSSAEKWLRHQSCYKNLRELSLVNCIIASGRGLSYLLGRCEALERLHLDMCLGVEDTDIIALSQKSRNLTSISIRLPSQFLAPVFLSCPLRLTDEGLKALAINCAMLEVFELSFSGGEFPSYRCFSQSGILALVQTCPIRVLVLDSACFFNDSGMEALISSPYLQTLKLIKCHEVTDDGMQLIQRFPLLTNLNLCKCLGVTDGGLKPLIGLCKLKYLKVEDCPQISENGVQGTAMFISYKQDSSWLY
ncbi:hypothetical protein OPV22_006368 [Ensete ventricosum]|uniref:F-box domain-containing protein n=1 Tax=Ensete ventricosum TaxID=4639 RepID=A0AAV8Q3Z7_ENSVE|nr:hypothetical protein OPV22_006368 [Ensete ventricosum]